MNIRHIVLLGLLGLSAFSQAQTFEIEAGSGASIQGGTIIVNPGQIFSVKVFLNMQGATASTSYITMAMAFATSGASNNPLSFVSGAESSYLSSNLPQVFPTGNFEIRDAAIQDPGNYSTGNGLLPKVVYHFKGVTSGASMISISGRRELATFTFANSLSSGDTWGDSTGETGLFLAFQNRPYPMNGASGYSQNSVGSSKYMVQAVPEPATLFVLGAGLVGVARKRRKG